MPVLREQYRIGSNTQSRAPLSGGGIVRAEQGGSAAASYRAWGQLAAEGARWSERLGRLMGEEAQTEARAMAEAIDLDENMEPIWAGGEVLRNRMGYLGGKAFDSALEIRQRNRIDQMVRAQLGVAAEENWNNPAGFEADAAAISEGIASTIPEAHAGFAKDSIFRWSKQYGMDIGRRVSAQNRQNTVEAYNTFTTDAQERMFQHVLAGEHGEADALLGQWNVQADATAAMELIGTDNVDEARNTLLGIRALGGIVGQINAEDWSAAKIVEVADDLVRGGETYGGEFPNERSREAGAQRLRLLAREVEGRENQQRQRTLVATNIDTTLRGGFAGMDPTHKPDGSDFSVGQIVDLAIARAMPSGRAPTLEDWIAGNVDERAFETMELAGVASETMLQAYRAVFSPSTEGRAPSDAMVLWRNWRRISDGRTPEGNSTTIAGKLPPEVVQPLLIMDALYERGIPAETAYGRAVSFGINGVNNEAITRRLTNDRGWAQWLGARSGLITDPGGAVLPADTVAANLNTALAERITTDIREQTGVDVLSAQDTQAFVNVYKILLQDGVPNPEALLGSMVKQVERSYPTTHMMVDVTGRSTTRSQAAPEVRYAMPFEQGLFTVASHAVGAERPWVQDWIEGEVRDRAAEALPDGEMDFGADADIALRVPAGADPHARYPVYEVTVMRDGYRHTLTDAETGRALIVSPRQEFLAIQADADRLNREAARRERDREIRTVRDREEFFSEPRWPNPPDREPPP